MLVKLLSDQISEHWGNIEFAIKNSLPPTVGESTDKMNNILLALLDNRMDCWVSVDSDTQQMEGVCVSQILEDDASKTKSLLLYCIYSFNSESANDKSWDEAFMTMVKYARSLGCTRITAYSDIDYIIERAKQFGGDTRFTFISFAV